MAQSLAQPRSCAHTPSSLVRPSRPASQRVSRRALRCQAVLTREQPPKPKQQARDVACHASDEAAAVPEPVPEQPERSSLASLALAASLVVENSVKVPYLAYSSALKTHPLLTKACTSMVGFVLGDLIAQHFAHPHGTIDVLRCLRLGAYGLLVDGPVGSAWYDVLEQRVFPAEPASTKAVLAKTALDQLVYATIMTGVYFATIKLMEGAPGAIAPTLAAKFWPTLAANYVIWPLAHLINFRFVPSDYRILYNNCVCVAWLTYLSLLTHTKFDLLSTLSSLLHL